MSVSIRKTAVNIILNIEKNDAYVNIEMNKLRAANLYSQQDIRLIGELVNGVVKRKITLDHIISLHSSTKVKKIAPYVLNVLRLGVYQLLFMDKIPPNAAVDECVKIIKRSSVSRLSGYVNAVLRSISKEDLNNLPSDPVESLSVRYSFPLWIVKRWCSEFGYDFTQKLLASFNEKSPMYVRCNTLRNSLKEFEACLTSSGLDYTLFSIPEFPDYRCSYRIDNLKDINLIPGYAEGAFYIQDPAASLAAFLTEAKPGDKVIDLCAAPGGKSLYMAELMNDEGEVISCDIYEHKIKLISDNAHKYHLKSVKPYLNDATVFNNYWYEYADVVLCDVPCSGLGIIRKKPDIKYKRTEDDISSLAALSMKILDNASKYVKPGGTLVFSTCTIEYEENYAVISDFLASHKDFSYYPYNDISSYTLYPHINGTDGFYICRLRKMV